MVMQINMAHIYVFEFWERAPLKDIIKNSFYRLGLTQKEVLQSLCLDRNTPSFKGDLTIFSIYEIDNLWKCLPS